MQNTVHGIDDRVDHEERFAVTATVKGFNRRILPAMELRRTEAFFLLLIVFRIVKYYSFKVS